MSDIAVLHLYKVGDDVIVAMSQRRRDDERRFVMGLEFRHVAFSASAEAFGETLLAALDEAGALSPTAADPKGRYKAWQVAISQEAGCTSWRAFRKATLLVDVLRDDAGKIQVAPAAHEGTKFMLLADESETLHNPAADQLGTTAQHAFAFAK